MQLNYICVFLISVSIWVFWEAQNNLFIISKVLCASVCVMGHAGAHPSEHTHSSLTHSYLGVIWSL